MILNLKILKSEILLLAVIIFNFLSFVFGTYYFLLISLIFLMSAIKSNIVNLCVFLFISPFFLLVGFDNFKIYILMVFSILLYSTKFSFDILKSLKLYSFFFLPFLVILPFLEQRYGDTKSVFMLNDRLWPIVFGNGTLNPNVIAIISALVSIGFYVNKKYFLFLISLCILVLTQSRASILFLIIVLFFFSLKNFKQMFTFGFSFFLIFMSIKNTPLMNRFNNLQENGRLDRTLIYMDIINNSFPLGVSFSSYQKIQDLYGGIDNMYLLSYIYYGLFSVLIFLIFIFYQLNNSNDAYSRLRIGLFIGFFVYGVFEASFIGNFMLWFVFSLCFNSFGKNSNTNIFLNRGLN